VRATEPFKAAGAEQGYQIAGGGHAWVLSDLKTLLETGKSFAN
jgi:hypothetical protein